MTELFQGVVTFLFTDVEGSTALWEEARDSMMDALRLHDGIIEAAAAAHHGIPVKPRGEGDSRFVVFDSATNAVAAAARIQTALADARWPTPRPLRVRISLHTGSAELQLGDYYGTAVNRAARLRAIAHGGQTVMSRSTWELVRDSLPTGVTVVDMGDHRLKDLTRPEHVYQVNVTGLEGTFPPLASLDAVRTNLPIQVTEFIGRDRELGEVVDLLAHCRLVTILAPGGAGKTRLAAQAAADVSGLHPDGVFFVDLSPLTTPAEVPQAVAEAMGVTLSGESDPGKQLLDHLSQDTVLLVLDNFEHVLDAADLVATMMRAAPGVRVIVTSRTKLGIDGETVYPLRGLGITWDAPENAHRVGGVQLFIDAAKRADASFSLSLADLDALAEILAIVGGLPLGILLAAAWVEALSVRDIATELAASMDFLTSDLRNLPERQRSMRAVFDYSWRLLGEADRSLFAALSPFRGGFDRKAALAVAGATPRNLATLVGKSLLIADRDTGRYVVQETLRRYAEESLGSDPARREAVVGAHLGYYADLAHDAEAALVTSRDQRGAILAIDADLENLRSALKETLRMRDASQARRLLMSLAWFYELRGWIRAEVDLVAEVKAAFATVEGEAAAIVHAVSMAFEAKLLTNLGHPEEAGRLAPVALKALEHCGDAAAYVSALEVLCENLVFSGDFEGVIGLSAETIRAARAAGLEVWATGMLNYQAMTHLLQGDRETAARLLAEADRVLAGADEHIFRTWTLEGRAVLAMIEGRVADTIQIRTEQLELARDIGYVRAIGLSLHGLAVAHLEAGAPGTARAALFESLSTFERMGLATNMAAVLVALARVLAVTGSPQRAAELLACVLGDPVRDQYSISEQATVGELAEQTLGRLESELATDVFAAARRSGQAKTLAVMVKEQLEQERRIA